MIVLFSQLKESTPVGKAELGRMARRPVRPSTKSVYEYSP